MPRAWFDDISTSAYGSPVAVEEVIIKTTTMLAHSLKREGLELADKSVIFSPDWKMTKGITSRLNKKLEWILRQQEKL
eukprot:2256103-Pyramimonas_sp.AAC.1